MLRILSVMSSLQVLLCSLQVFCHFFFSPYSECIRIVLFSLQMSVTNKFCQGTLPLGYYYSAITCHLIPR